MALCLPSLAAAQDELGSSFDAFDEEMLLFQDIPSVYGASKYEQKVTEAPSSVSIVTADEIKKYGYRTLSDILQSLRGFFTTYDRNYAYASVRGFGQPGDYNTRLLLLLDGHRLNDNVYDSAAIGTDFILDVDLIDRVEVIRGPSSSLYGTSAFFGVINVITKRGRDFQSAEVAASFGSFDTKQGRATYGNKFANGAEVLLSGTYTDSDGDDHLYFPEFDDPATNHGVAEDADDDEFASLFAKLSLWDLSFEGAYVSREKRIPTASYETVFNDRRSYTEDDQLHLNLRYEHSFTNQFALTGDLYYNRYDYDGDYVYDYSEDDEPYIVINKDDAQGRWWGGELQFTINAFEKHRLIFGGEYQDNLRQDQGNYDEEVYLDDKRDSSNWGVYVQDEYALFDNLIINAGVRHDHHESFGGTTNPRLALIYSPFAKSTLKLLYGSAFRAPNVYELYYHDGFNTQKPALNLDPETITTTELLLEQSIGKHLRGVAGIFYYKIKDLITLQTDSADDLLVFNNVDDVEAHGLELELEGKWSNGWQGRFSYTYQETEDQSTGKILPNSPKHLAKANLIAPLLRNKLFAGLELRYTGTRKTVRGTDADAFTVTNLTLFGQNVLKGLDLSASVYNLFDEEYADPGSEGHLQDTLEQDGRTFRLKLHYAF